MATAIAPRQATAPAVLSQIENVLINGDLKTLTPEQRVAYYKSVCESVGLNPLTRPFEYLVLQGKMILYARKDCTEQLRAVHGISLRITDRQMIDDVYVVTAEAQDAKGRVDTSTGAVACGALKGEAKANALMKAETKAKRRVTLSIAGLGMLDETEVETIPNAKPFEDARWKPEAAPKPEAEAEGVDADTYEVMTGEAAELVDDATRAALILSMSSCGLDPAVICSAYRIKSLAELPADKAQECANRIRKYADTKTAAAKEAQANG
jgi:hypothetical protein